MERMWAPWRLTYITGDEPRRPGCFFCNAWNDRGNEREHFLLARDGPVFAMLNRYPYANGHLMVAPARHVGDMEDVTPEEGAALWRMAVRAKLALARAFRPDGFNAGINQGRAAGAGVLDHLHFHIVPRWSGDNNFMPVLADVRVIPQALEEAYRALRPHFDKADPGA